MPLMVTQTDLLKRKCQTRNHLDRRESHQAGFDSRFEGSSRSNAAHRGTRLHLERCFVAPEKLKDVDKFNFRTLRQIREKKPLQSFSFVES